jgi:hypothetical protein
LLRRAAQWENAKVANKKGSSMRAIPRFVLKVTSLSLLFLLAACVITTEKSYFSPADFVRPKVLSGDWVSLPTEPGDEILKMRIETHGKLWRAQPLTPEGQLDASEKPIDFGLVQLGPGEFILVQSDDPKGPFNYLGLAAQEDKLSFYLFSGGESQAGKERFAALIADLKIARDPAMTSEARLTGDLSAEKLKKLFEALLADPAKFDGHPSVYARINP